MFPQSLYTTKNNMSMADFHPQLYAELPYGPRRMSTLPSSSTANLGTVNGSAAMSKSITAPSQQNDKEERRVRARRNVPLLRQPSRKPTVDAIDVQSRTQ